MSLDEKDKKAMKKRIEEEEDFIYCPRLGNSLGKLIKNNPDGIDDGRIQKVLLLSKNELNEWYNKAVGKLREKLNVERKD